MQPLPTSLPSRGQLFRHVDGGYYRFVTCARHTDDTQPLFIYSHVWPFDGADTWARPAHEWESRFTAVSDLELEQAQTQSPELARQAVMQAKARRRAQEAANQAASRAAT